MEKITNIINRVRDNIPEIVKPLLRFINLFGVGLVVRKQRWLKDERLLKYSPSQKKFLVMKSDLEWEQKMLLRRSMMINFKTFYPLYRIKLQDINIGYFDQCLVKYTHERETLLIKNEDTCWGKYACNNWCYYWSNPDNKFNSDEKMYVIKKLNAFRSLNGSKSIFHMSSITKLLIRDESGYVFIRSDHKYEEDDRVLSIVNSIRKNGFKNKLSTLLSPIIIGYSNITGIHNVISGRHRIAALKYLFQEGELDGKTIIKCHLVEYPFESITLTRPFTNECKQCMAKYHATA